MLSYWESETFLDYDVIIVGAGITGLSATITILEKQPDLNILVLEKSLFPDGASTKNAGFACFGSLTELLDDMQRMGELACLDLVQQRWKGLLKLRSRFSDKEIGYEGLGGYELINKNQKEALSQIEKVNKLLTPIFKTPVFEDVSNRIDEMGFNSQTYSGLVFNAFEGQINTGKTINSLWYLATKLGAKILTGADVESTSHNTVNVKTAKDIFTFKSKKVVLCTNAFAMNLFPDLDIVPGRGQVMITNPIDNLKFKGTFHIEEGYFYFRNVGNRVLIGGGRHLDFKGEETLKNGIHPEIEKELLRILKEDILPNQEFNIVQQWSGIMAFGAFKKPILEWVNNDTLLAVRLGGMGMAIGSELGDLVSVEIEKTINKK